jgi:hypothetical protein
MDLSDVGWRKSSRSQGGGQNCVEVAGLPWTAVAIRDSKDPNGPVHIIRPSAYRNLIERIKHRELDL